jgi:hypothetical protein
MVPGGIAFALGHSRTRTRAISIMLAGLALAVVAKPSVGQQTAPDPAVWTVPEIGALPNDAHGCLVRRGRDLITATYALSARWSPIPPNATQATIWRARVVICRPQPRCSGCRCSV